MNDRQEKIRDAIMRYRSGEFGGTRLRAVLGSCGMNASEIDATIGEHRDAALHSMKERCKGCGE